MKKVECQICGAVFRGGDKARYCPECRARKAKETARAHAKERNLSALGVAAKKKAREEANENEGN